MKILRIFRDICYSPAGRAVLGKTVPGVLSTARDRTQDRGQSFSQYGPTKAGKYCVYFFLCGITSKATFVLNFN